MKEYARTSTGKFIWELCDCELCDCQYMKNDCSCNVREHFDDDKHPHWLIKESTE